MEFHFESLPQRSVWYFLKTFSPFYPAASAAAGEDAQRNAYAFIKSIYTRLYEDPALLNLKAVPDDAFAPWVLQKTKPDLAPKIRKNTAKIEAFIALLFSVLDTGTVAGDTVRVPKDGPLAKAGARKQLAAFGIPTQADGDEWVCAFPQGLTNGLALLARISNENMPPQVDGKPKPYLLFSRGVFDPAAAWTAQVFAGLFEQRAGFDRLCAFLNESGYTRVDNRGYDHNITLDYVKNYGKPGDPLKWAWGERAHSGVEFLYDELRANPLSVSMRIPFFDQLLHKSDAMSPELRDFVTAAAKKCDQCGYCVLTDKTGRRPLSCIEVNGQSICPLFCGFSFRWNTLDEARADQIIALLRFIDETFKDKLTAL